MSKVKHKTNVPPDTEITLTLTLEEWFSIIAELNLQPISAYGKVCKQRAGEKIARQLAEWSKL